MDTTDGPQPGLHNWFRGGTLRTFEANTLDALNGLAGHLDIRAIRLAWGDALDATWDGIDRWFHADFTQAKATVEAVLAEG